MNKTLRTGVIVCVVSVILVVCLALLLTFLGKNIKPKSEVLDDVTKYEEIMGQDSVYYNAFSTKNDIFPRKIVESATVEDFRMEYKQPYDGKYNYMAYLVYTCDNDEDFEAEYARLSSLNCIDEESYKDVYGIEDFEYTLLAIYADEEHVVYSLCMEQSRRFVYFGLNFNKYYTDIEYSKHVNATYLPNGFNAYWGNAVYEEHRK